METAINNQITVGSIVNFIGYDENWKVTDYSRSWYTIVSELNGEIKKARGNQVSLAITTEVEETEEVAIEETKSEVVEPVESEETPSSVEETEEVESEEKTRNIVVVKPTPNAGELNHIKSLISVSKEVKKAVKKGAMAQPTKEHFINQANAIINQFGLGVYLNNKAFDELQSGDLTEASNGLWIMRLQNILVGASSRKRKDMES